MTLEERRRGDPSPTPDLKVLRAAIPAHCFQPSLFKSMQYVVRDLILMAVLFALSFQLGHLQSSFWRTLSWTLYGFLQGLVFTGVWILAHECGHDSFSSHGKINATIGFVLHSILLVPYFSWKYSHSRHHRYANNMEKDTVFVPVRKQNFRDRVWTGSFLGHAEDSPIVSMTLFLSHQVLGWPIYLVFNAGAGSKSLVQKDRSTAGRQSHLDPGSNLFTRKERPYVLLSNLGLAATMGVLCYGARLSSFYNMFLVYGLPYVWMNHWLIAITFLHHTHPDVPHYEEDAWTFQKGAMSTIDRDFGFVGEYLFHGIIEYHVVHHMFPRIPFYHAKEATQAIKPLMGHSYMEQRSSSFLHDLWRTFKTCNYVEHHPHAPGHVYWSKARG